MVVSRCHGRFSPEEPQEDVKLCVRWLASAASAHLWLTLSSPSPLRSQVFTNPLEIVKIRLQMQGQTAAAPGIVRQGAGHIIKQLGLIGLYKGAIACLARDVPFSAIYFPAYAHLKKDVFHEGRDGKVLAFSEALASAAIAGMPAAYLSVGLSSFRLAGVVESGLTVLHCVQDHPCGRDQNSPPNRSSQG